ncbi:MAG: hypothetical protein AAGA32_22400, partial [Pseudomonadota bacterium]
MVSRHPLRRSPNVRSRTDRRAVAAELREVSSAETADAAREALAALDEAGEEAGDEAPDEAVDEAWGSQSPSIAQAWRLAWEDALPVSGTSIPWLDV